MEDSLYYNMYQERLTQDLLKLCTGRGMLEGMLLQSQDIDDKWDTLAPEYIADGVKEIAAYPTVSVAWAAYMGMAVACWWNRDWNRLKDQPYSALLGSQGFDNMDDHIMADILGLTTGSIETAGINETIKACADSAVAHIRQERIEPQSPRAFYVYARTAQVMFRIGAALELYRLGYEMRKLTR